MKKTTKIKPEVHVTKQYHYKTSKGRKTIDTTIPKESDLFFTAFEPKVKQRHIVYIKDIKNNIVIAPYVIQYVDRPKGEMLPWYDGKGTKTKIYWRPIVTKMYDPIVPSTTQAVINHLLDGNEPVTITIKVLGPVGDTVEEWEIKDAVIQRFGCSSLDWKDTGEPATVEVEWKSQNITLKY